MAAKTINFFNCFGKDCFEKTHDFASDAIKAALTNTLPEATQTELDTVTDHPPPAAANGYAAQACALVSSSQTGGTYTLDLADAQFAASGGQIGPFRYVVIYNDTPAGKPLIAWYDRGSETTLEDGDTLDLEFDEAGFFSATQGAAE